MWTQGKGVGRQFQGFWDILIGIEYLLEHLEDWRQHYKPITAEMALESSTQASPQLLTPLGLGKAI